MADEDMTEAEDLKTPIVHGMIDPDSLVERDDATNIETQAAETLALPEVSMPVRRRIPEIISAKNA